MSASNPADARKKLALRNRDVSPQEIESYEVEHETASIRVAMPRWGTECVDWIGHCRSISSASGFRPETAHDI
jgi:hypothetical protein